MLESDWGKEIDLSRRGGEECGGACKHSSVYHVVRIKNIYGDYDLACAKMDCSCLKFIATGKKNQDAR